MESVDLKWIKRHYGEKFSHLCRDMFPTILEEEGMLSKLLSEHFPPSRELYDDILQNDLINSFRNYIYSLTKTDENKVKVTLTPEELMEKAGYILYPECKTEEDIQSFRHYYYRGSPTPNYNGGTPARYAGEELCTFNGNRLASNHVWFAVKKNVCEIRRKDFENPRREDDYGVSVLSIQFSRSKPNVLSIKNRYNHTVANPDATFSNNLDNIIQGLTQAFENTYGISLAQNNSTSFEIPNYVQARDGKFYKYNQEYNNIYYCPNNIIIQNGEVTRFDKDKWIVFDYFILDLKGKEIIDYNLIQGNHQPDSFPESVGKINDIKRVPNENGLTIQITPKNGEIVEIELDKHNQITGYRNPNVEEIGDFFLFINKSLKSLDLPNVKRIEGKYLFPNTLLTRLNLPSVYAEFFGENFWRCNKSLTKLNLPNVEQIGDNFLQDNESLTELDLPNVRRIGSNFLLRNKSLKNINLPNVEQIDDNFLYCNESLTSLKLPNVEQIGNNFLHRNESLTSLNLPNIKQIGNYLLYNDESLASLTLPNVEHIGDDFLSYNQSLTSLNLPNAKQIGNNFLYCNESLTSLKLPNAKQIGDNFLQDNESLTELDLPNVRRIGNNFLFSNKSLKNINLPNVEQIGTGFLYNNKPLRNAMISFEQSFEWDILKFHKIIIIKNKA